MFAQKYRLTGKDISFLTKKKQAVYAGSFIFFYCSQNARLEYHKISFHISLKLSKSSVFRHLVKRALLEYVQKHSLLSIQIKKQFYKIFIILDKNKIALLQKQIEKLDRKGIMALFQDEFASSRKVLLSKIKV